MTMRKRYNKILNSHGIYGEDCAIAMYAISQILDAYADEMKESEPYATKTIGEIERASYVVFDIAVQIEEE